MRFTSDLLYRWLAALGTGDSFPAGQDLEVPVGIVPVVNLSGPVPVAQNSLVTSIYRESFFQTRRLANVGAAAAFTEVLANLGRGLWEIECLLTGISSFTTTQFDVDGGFRMQVVDPLGGIANLLEHELVNNVPMFLRSKNRWLFEEEPWVFRASVPATAALQVVAAMFGIRGNRLN